MQQRVVRRNENVGIKCNCARRVERIGGPNSTRLQIKLLKLKADRPRSQVEH